MSVSQLIGLSWASDPQNTGNNKFAFWSKADYPRNGANSCI